MLEELSDVTETDNIDNDVTETETDQIASDEGSNDDLENELSFTDTQKYSKRLNKDREKIREELEEESNKRIEDELDDTAKSLGYDSWEDYQEHIKVAKLDNLGVTDTDAFEEIVKSAVEESDAVKEAKKIIEQNKRKEQEKLLTDEIKQVSELDPSIKDISDFTKLENYDEFEQLVRRGYTLVEAYKLSNFDKLMDSAVNKKQNAEYIEKTSTQHQVEGKGTVTATETIDAATMNTFRQFYPTLSDSELIKKYLAMKGDKK